MPTSETHVPELSESDFERLKLRYAQEREKRVRPDGRRQFVEPVGTEGFLKDPYADPIEREPLLDEVEVVIVGGGFGGLTTGARLRELGVEQIRFIDKAGDFGGTWYWNRYPGARCDIESYIYMPLLEETGYMPSEKYATCQEILEHAQRIAHHYDLYRDTCFQTFVTKLEWDDAASRWTVHTSRGDQMRARFVFTLPGPLQRPHLPAIPGIDSFTGRMFLTSRWDYEYTKGEPTGGLTGLLDKRVAIIGTGATGIQAIPKLAEYCEHLYVVQRTPCSLGERANPPTDPEWARSLEPGWQARRMRNFSNIVSGVPQEEDLVSDPWTRLLTKFSVFVPRGNDGEVGEGGIAEALERIDIATQEEIRRHIDAVVDDPQSAAALKPYFRQFCKRPTFSSDYFETFNRPNVTLLDTAGRGLDRITDTSIVLGDVEYEVDCIILASGFEADVDFQIRSGFEIVGRDGVTLAEHWKDGARTFQCLFVHGFPNLILVGNPPHGGFYYNWMNKIHEDLEHMVHVVGYMLRSGDTIVEATAEAEERWVRQSTAMAAPPLDFLRACTPGQYNNYGKPDDTLTSNTNYAAGTQAWEAAMEEWRATGGLAGLRFE